jgi:hypothetical protein
MGLNIILVINLNQGEPLIDQKYITHSEWLDFIHLILKSY